MFFKFKHLLKYLIIIIFILFQGCQLNHSKNKHGIAFLENRANKVKINLSNTNDVINLIGQPHSKSHNNELEWIYIERVFQKGKFHKLGRNVLIENNVLILGFDKYGILRNKKLLDKNDIKKLSFSEEITENN